MSTDQKTGNPTGRMAGKEDGRSGDELGRAGIADLFSTGSGSQKKGEHRGYRANNKVWIPVQSIAVRKGGFKSSC